MYSSKLALKSSSSKIPCPPYLRSWAESPCAWMRLQALGKPTYVPESFVGMVLAQLTLALLYMHSKKVAHRDVKLKNVFMTETFDVKVKSYAGTLGLLCCSRRFSRFGNCFWCFIYSDRPLLVSAAALVRAWPRVKKTLCRLVSGLTLKWKIAIQQWVCSGKQATLHCSVFGPLRVPVCFHRTKAIRRTNAASGEGRVKAVG